MYGTLRPPSESPRVYVIGIAGDGWATLSADARTRIEAAPTVMGGQRQLDLLPDIPGQTRILLPRPLRVGLYNLLADTAEAVVLASGDPLVSGIGSTLIDVLGEHAVEIAPSLSSIALARARMRWPAETCAVVSVVGRDIARVRRECAPGRRILVLSSDENTPGLITRMLTDDGYGASPVTVLGDLGTSTESRIHGIAETWDAGSSRLNIVAIEVVGASRGIGWVAGLPDDAYEHDGQLTKRHLRASALAHLAPAPGEHLWDIGAGAGSIGIEWMRAHPTCLTTAIEANRERAARIARNAANLGVPDLVVVNGRAPEALADLHQPAAIFIGGGATGPGVLGACLTALAPGGRLVVHGVTLETEQLLSEAYRTHGGELTRISVETAAPVGTFTGWTPARAVTQWALTR